MLEYSNINSSKVLCALIQVNVGHCVNDSFIQRSVQCKALNFPHYPYQQWTFPSLLCAPQLEFVSCLFLISPCPSPQISHASPIDCLWATSDTWPQDNYFSLLTDDSFVWHSGIYSGIVIWNIIIVFASFVVKCCPAFRLKSCVNRMVEGIVRFLSTAFVFGHEDFILNMAKDLVIHLI